MIRRMIASMLLLTAAATAASAGGDAKPKPRQIDISVTEAGFEPTKVFVSKGEEVTLAFTRKTDKTCAKDVVVYVNDKDKVTKALPLNQAVKIGVAFSKSGELRYACGMDMYGGVIVVQ